MKNIGLIFVLIFLSTIAYSSEKDNTNEKADTISRKNEIGLVVTDLIDGSFELRYERKVGNHISLGLGAAMKGKSGLFTISGIDRERLKTGDITYSGFKLIPDVRYYLEKTQQYELDGFYFGAYSKYFHFNSDLNGSYISKDGTNYDIAFDAKINILSVGLMLGYKLALNKHFNLDFMILGPGTSHHSYKLVPTKQIPDEFYDDLNEALKNFSLYDLIQSDFRFNFKESKTNFSTFSFRYGLTVSYTF